jgi:hypothetical protein
LIFFFLKKEIIHDPIFFSNQKSTQAGVTLTIEGCHFAPPSATAAGLKTDQTDYAVYFSSGSDHVRCDVIHYYSTDQQIICETRQFPKNADYVIQLFVNGRQVGKEGYGRMCRHCRISAYDDYSPLIKKIYPANYAKNGGNL